jgi:hypothetical protein
MRFIFVILTSFILTSCASRDIKIVSPPADSDWGSKTSCVSGMIVDTNRILKPFLTVDTNKYKIGFNIPQIPVGLDLEKQEQHKFYKLAEKMSQDNIAMNNALLAIVLMRNMAPCDPKNIELSWKTMQLFIRSVKAVYDEKN